MTDRLVFVHLGFSIPLHKKGVNGKVTSISNPFGRYKKEFNEYIRRNINDLARP